MGEEADAGARYAPGTCRRLHQASTNGGMVTEDERYMSRAIALAADVAFASSNPRVGAVLVRAGQVIAEAAHRGAGTPHAEALALAGADATGATLYVTLEPCTHHGRTPPCAPAIVEAGVAKVVVAIEDPDQRVAGRGIAYLREHGVEIELGPGAPEAIALNEAYLHHRRTGRPLVTLKLALSLDGKMAASDGSSRWITGDDTRREVHRLRARSDGILVGAGTVLADDPLFTARDVAAERQPVRVIVDSSGRVPSDAAVFGPGEVIVMTGVGSTDEARTAWKAAGAEVVVVDQRRAGEVDLQAVIENLGGRGWLELLCEGGAELATSLLRDDLVDRLVLHYGPVTVGDDGLGIGSLGVASMSDARRWRTLDVGRIGEDAIVTLGRDA